MSRFSRPVAVVGGGAVGLLLALCLDKYDVPCVVFNSETESRWHPKGNTHNSRTMEHYRWLGIADEIRKLGLPDDYPQDIAYLTTLCGYELCRILGGSKQQLRNKVNHSANDDQVPEPLLRANQMYVERFLLQHVKSKKISTLNSAG
ncbi:MAG: FAD-dependent monooxygenase, partial [Gammaproteobacteria bacterium]|nr:FAD-dependent monooxygenase [Gammaproteobacteria bacterium]